MRNIKTKKHIITISLIIKDIIKLSFQCLVATIFASICIENGWILSDKPTDISYDMFWELYSLTVIVVPLVMFYRGITSKYHVEIKECKSNLTMGMAKQSNKALFEVVKDHK